MRIWLHIGPAEVGAPRLKQVMAENRGALLQQGVLYPHGPGDRDHPPLSAAVAEPGPASPSPSDNPEARQALGRDIATALAGAVAEHRPETLILICPELGTALHRRAELERLRALLAPLSEDLRILAYCDEPARHLARVYAAQVMAGRAAPLSRELALVPEADWWRACLAAGQGAEPAGPAPFWLDAAALADFWEGTFGAGSVALRPYDAETLAGPGVAAELRAAFGIAGGLGDIARADPPAQPSAAWLARARQLNALLHRTVATDRQAVPHRLWQAFLGEIEIDGAPIDPGSLCAVSRRFGAQNAALLARHPALSEATFRPPPPRPDWTEADPERGYRASQYLLAFQHRIDRARRRASDAAGAGASNERRIVPEAPGSCADRTPDLGPVARKLMPEQAVQNFIRLKSSRYAPHNRLGRVQEAEPAAAYAVAPPPDPPQGTTGKVVVGCMKDEAPYILEWIAHHRAIGVDQFLIYTNDCSDGTAEMLGRLQEIGIVQHRRNDDWKGKSPQQHALNRALKEPLVRKADWIIHIDVDEFINVRTGNGTLDDFLALVPEATNVAMTWRLFGHNGVTRLSDGLVIDQFDACAPSYCPKPHTVWGFKTMVRNIGAYRKLSCHRPNQLEAGFRDRVTWVNGSGRDMTDEAAERGWRSSTRSIGYDLLQLNHYALRSAESFLIKRQRGRALHVDRAIGLNYWIRMDWSDARDLTIKRNIPRLRAELDRLLADEVLARWHRHGLDWHRAKADALQADPEFAALYHQVLGLRLTAPERVAYALALDMES